MKPADARELVETLLAAYPYRETTEVTVAVYVRSLLDLGPEEVGRAVSAAVATRQWLPPVSVIRELVFEERLQLDTPEESWEHALALSRWTPDGHEPCLACATLGTRMYEPGDDRRTAAEVVCPECKGDGEVPVGRPPSLQDHARRALDFVGGQWEIRTTERPDRVREQFLRACGEFRREEVSRANLDSLGVRSPAALERGDGRELEVTT